MLINAAQIIVLFIVFRLIYKRPLSQMGFSLRHWRKHLGLGCLVGFVAISAYAVAAQLTGVARFTGFDAANLLTPNMLVSLVFFISVGFYEEILFRGFLMTAMKTTRNKIAIIGLPAAIFGVMHTLNPYASIVGIVNILLIGLAFAYMFIKTGSLWMPIGYHIIWNFVQGNIYGIAVSGMGQASSLMKYTPAGPDILTGGAFGAEGGLICTAITLALLAYLRYVYRPGETPAWTMDSDLPFDTRKL
jgi:membrane protease YdiL (CAAX protease family)